VHVVGWDGLGVTVGSGGLLLTGCLQLFVTSMRDMHTQANGQLQKRHRRLSREYPTALVERFEFCYLGGIVRNLIWRMRNCDMNKTIRVMILEDFQSTIDGYHYRLDNEPDIEIVATVSYGHELERTLSENQPIHVLLLDIRVPLSATDKNPYPILHVMPTLLERYPELHILVVSMYTQPVMIQAAKEAGASGYIVKDDRDALSKLSSVIHLVAGGSVFFSREAHEQLLLKSNDSVHLSLRQKQVLSLCAAYPDMTSAEIGEMVGVADTTVRNLLSQIYTRLEVRGRAAAIAKATQVGLVSPVIDVYPLDPSLK